MSALAQKPASCAGDDDRANRRLVFDCCVYCRAQFAFHAARPGVEPFRSVERNGRDAIGDLVDDPGTFRSHGCLAKLYTRSQHKPHVASPPGNRMTAAAFERDAGPAGQTNGRRRHEKDTAAQRQSGLACALRWMAALACPRLYPRRVRRTWARRGRRFFGRAPLPPPRPTIFASRPPLPPHAPTAMRPARSRLLLPVCPRDLFSG